MSARPSWEDRWRQARDAPTILVQRDPTVLYQRSTLGFGWALATPLLTPLDESVKHQPLLIHLSGAAELTQDAVDAEPLSRVYSGGRASTVAMRRPLARLISYIPLP